MEGETLADGMVMRVTNVSPARARWTFQLPMVAGQDAPEAFVLGDPNDTDEFLASKGWPRDPRLCPNPVAHFDGAEWERIGPRNREIITLLVDSGELETAQVPA